MFTVDVKQLHNKLLIWIKLGRGHTVVAGADGGCLDIFSFVYHFFLCLSGGWSGWSGGAMVLGKLPVPGRPTIWITVVGCLFWI